jgi:hypothetical protein
MESFLMSASPPINLYNLLPALYRIRDAENGYQLQAFLQIISDQANIVKGNIDGLWDDLFIETCAPWVIPYIGDLVANNPLHDVGIGIRGDVAHTIYYRRRKGTLPMLETLARDVTRWGAHAVAFFEELGWTQNLNHERMVMPAIPPPPPAPALPTVDPFSVNRVGTVNLRDLDTLDKIGGPFDITTHTVDVRPICQTVGWYNIKKVGFFLWRLQSYALAFVTPRQSSHYADGYHFSPLGNPAPLFTQPPLTIQDMQQITESQAPGPIRPAAFYFHPSDYYGAVPLSSFGIYRGSDALTATLYPAAQIVCRDLSGWTPPPSGFVAVDVALGRLAFAPGESPAQGLLVNFSYGFSGDMGGGAYDRNPAVDLTSPSATCDCATTSSTLTFPDTLNQPNFFGPLLQVPFGATTTISQAIAAWAASGSPPAVIQVNGSGTYNENLAIDLPANGVLVIQSANQERPVLLGNIAVTAAAGATASLFMLAGFVVAGQLHVSAALEALDIVHSTLVPGLGLDESGDPVSPDSPSLIVDAPNANLQILIDHSITGALQVPEDVLGLTVRDSIIDSPIRSGQAELSPVLVSGNLSPFPALTSTNPVVNITIGDEGPYPAAFPDPPQAPPTTLTDARDQLQTAIRAAHNTIAFTSARVLIVGGNRLAALSGTDEVMVIEVTDTDNTAEELRLDPDSARQTFAVVSGALPANPTLTATPPTLNVMIDTEGPHPAVMAAPFTTLPQIRDSLQAAIRAAFTTPAFTGACVTLADSQLVIIPGGAASAITLSTVPADTTTLFQLELESERPSIAGDPGGDLAGPPTTLERTTIFGAVNVQELVLASEVIFVHPVTSVRQQTGCVRFSFVPEGSVTPRRFRCQPDLEIQTETDAALALGPLTAAQRDAIRDNVRSWLVPAFTDIHYGLPAYAQLATSCPKQIRTGAEDGSEMGAFSFLQQPQRVTNLRVRLQEYLPFGLEAGLIYVT